MFCFSRHYAVILLFFLFGYSLFGLEPLPYTNPFLVGSAALTTLTDDPSNAMLNPAAGTKGISTSTCYLYGMSNLNQYELSSVFDYNHYGIVAAWQALDAKDYSRQDYRFGIRYRFKALKVAVGYRLSYDEIPGYGSERDSNPYAGLRLNYMNTTLDASANNFLSPHDNCENESERYDFSLGQKIANHTVLAFGLASSPNHETNFKAGCLFPIYENLQAIISWESEPGRFGFASDISFEWMHICYALQTHSELDWTHSIGLSVLFP